MVLLNCAFCNLSIVIQLSVQSLHRADFFGSRIFLYDKDIDL